MLHRLVVDAEHDVADDRSDDGLLGRDQFVALGIGRCLHGDANLDALDAARQEGDRGGRLGVEEAIVRSIVGDIVFGIDDETMEHAVVSLLADRGLTLAVAESVTGGLIASRITNVPGASKVFRGGVVSYASEVKYDVLDVPVGPVVTAEAAEAMAVGVRRLLKADVGIAVTGVAGPEPQENQPPGTVFFGIAIGDDVESRQVRMPGDRHRVQQFSAISLLDVLRRRLQSLG